MVLTVAVYRVSSKGINVDCCSAENTCAIKY